MPVAAGVPGIKLGLANVITKRFFDKIDTEKMYPNCLTSTVLTSARIPCVVANDREAIQMCIRTCTGIDRSRARIIRIPNSLHIGRIMLSEAYYRDVKAGKWPGVAACSEPEPLEFDGDGPFSPPSRVVWTAFSRWLDVQTVLFIYMAVASSAPQARHIQ